MPRAMEASPLAGVLRGDLRTAPECDSLTPVSRLRNVPLRTLLLGAARRGNWPSTGSAAEPPRSCAGTEALAPAWRGLSRAALASWMTSFCGALCSGAAFLHRAFKLFLWDSSYSTRTLETAVLARACILPAEGSPVSVLHSLRFTAQSSRCNATRKYRNLLRKTIIIRKQLDATPTNSLDISNRQDYLKLAINADLRKSLSILFLCPRISPVHKYRTSPSLPQHGE